MKQIKYEHWLVFVLLLLPLTTLASWPIPQKTIKVTPEVAKVRRIQVEFLASPSTNHVQVVVHCPDKNDEIEGFYSMEFRLIERGEMAVSSSMDPATKAGVVTGSFYVQKQRAGNCTVTLWYGEPFKHLVEFQIDLSEFVQRKTTPANERQRIHK